MTSRGRVWRFGDDVNTDLIIPGRYLDNYDPAHLASHAMEGLSQDFAAQVSKGDLIVAGRNFGCGSSREQAVVALKHAGVSAIIAVSFARIFYRNSVNLGLCPLISKDACAVFSDRDEVVLDMSASVLTSVDGSKTAVFERLPERVKQILDSGGLVQHIRSRSREV